ncbi:fimbria/pilus periplasmic chaperone [Burkholderia sp. MR1-5-21]
MKLPNIFRTLALTAAVFAAQADASVVISGTRVIFPAAEREVTVKITNDGNAPVLVQTWLDNGDANAAPEQIDVPFTLTPAMFRMEPGKGQSLRLIHTNEPLPKDKESLFWLNVLEVPPKAANDDRNKVQIAFRTRIKVIYRPDGLQGKAEDAPAQVKWEVVGENGKYALKATNPTQYIVNIGEIALKADGHSYEAPVGAVLPGETQMFPIKGLHAVPASGATVSFSSLNDWGAGKTHEQPIKLGK